MGTCPCGCGLRAYADATSGRGTGRPALHGGRDSVRGRLVLPGRRDRVRRARRVAAPDRPPERANRPRPQRRSGHRAATGVVGDDADPDTGRSLLPLRPRRSLPRVPDRGGRGPIAVLPGFVHAARDRGAARAYRRPGNAHVGGPREHQRQGLGSGRMGRSGARHLRRGGLPERVGGAVGCAGGGGSSQS